MTLGSPTQHQKLCRRCGATFLGASTRKYCDKHATGRYKGLDLSFGGPPVGNYAFPGYAQTKPRYYDHEHDFEN